MTINIQKFSLWVGQLLSSSICSALAFSLLNTNAMLGTTLTLDVTLNNEKSVYLWTKEGLRYIHELVNVALFRPEFLEECITHQISL